MDLVSEDLSQDIWELIDGGDDYQRNGFHDFPLAGLYPNKELGTQFFSRLWVKTGGRPKKEPSRVVTGR